MFQPISKIPRFLAPQECQAVRQAMDAGEREEAEILAGGIQRRASIRNAALVEPTAVVIDRIGARLDSCRAHISEAFGLALGEREGAGFLRYPEGGFYLPHRDRGDDPTWKAAARRAVALVLFLNSSRETSPHGDFDGGVLRLFPPDGEIDVLPEAGMLVAFPADMLHEVRPVRGGTRDTVVDWFYFESITGT